jgi:hypothetical protein
MPNKNKKVLLADESNTDGEEAVEKAVAEKPDLAPDTLAKPLDAFELLSKVRGHIGR